ncbi:esterase/lipase family protein [Variovorax ginsengisoli]|uniref:Triacylglycerol lipase n=1 Tax=Variovorax ginsengisoli TaxID=363844 RepID=A0ABT9S4E4_9BURK|nr:triacylglycerol lipase [Variovorax ginsengisoli]MDP9899090.1 triacylglycerol lipase [Variovorax ginsengisoli]
MNRPLFGAMALAALIGAAAPVAAADTYAATKYPIVLAHGLLGWDTAAGIDYWYGIPGDLQSHGAKVYTTKVSAVNSSEVRGEQLLQQVDTILAITGASKVNLVGHSQGNQSTRYVAAVAPGKVASVTSVSGTTGGSPVADLIAGAAPAGTFTNAVVNAVVSGLGSIIDLLSGSGGLPSDGNAVLTSLTTQGAANFNKNFPAGVPPTRCGQGASMVNGVRYYSWSGTSQITSGIDPSDSALSLTALAFKGTPNDGLVGQCDSYLGAVIRGDYALNHLDTINQFFGVAGFTDPVALYRQHANRLKLAGL